MASDTRQRKVLVGIYLDAAEKQPRFRQLYDDWKSARSDIDTWMAKGYCDIHAGGGRQDHYSPNVIYKVRLMPITKVVTQPNTTPDLSTSTEVYHYIDDAGSVIDPSKVEM